MNQELWDKRPDFDTENVKKARFLAAEIIKKYEGWKDFDYVCPAGKRTIGWGHTKGVLEGDRIGEMEGSRFLDQDIFDALIEIAKHFKKREGPLHINDPEWKDLDYCKLAVLMSFLFCFGGRKFSTSTLLDRLKSGDWDKCPHEIMRWHNCKIKGKMLPLKGLLRRRAEEALIFSTGRTLTLEIKHS